MRDDVEGPYPNPQGNWNDIFADFQSAFDNTFTERNLIALLGTHNSGRATYKHSGLAGRWGMKDDNNKISNNYYNHLMGKFKERDFTMVQSDSSTHVTGGGKGPFESPDPAFNKPQWTKEG